MFGVILKATNSPYQKCMTFCHSIYVKKVMKLLAFIFEQPSYWHFKIYEQDTFRAQLSYAWKSFITSGPGKKTAFCSEHEKCLPCILIFIKITNLMLT